MKARFALAQELAQSEDDASLLEAQQLFEQILDRHPENLAVLVVHARLASTRGDSAAAMAVAGGQQLPRPSAGALASGSVP